MTRISLRVPELRGRRSTYMTLQGREGVAVLNGATQSCGAIHRQRLRRQSQGLRTRFLVLRESGSELPSSLTISSVSGLHAFRTNRRRSLMTGMQLAGAGTVQARVMLALKPSCVHSHVLCRSGKTLPAITLYFAAMSTSLSSPP